MKRSMISQEIQWLLEEKHKGRKGLSFTKDIKRLQRGEHVDYVIGFVDFLGCKIDLSKRPFIPRPETEYWVEKAISDCSNSVFSLRFTPPAGRGPTRLQKSRSFRIRCLDLFAGSGCVGVAVLKHIPPAHVDFGEKDRQALSQIRLNAKKNDIEKKRYRVIQSNVFSNIRGKYDYIFANPPYIAESRKNRVQVSVLRHESREALFAGKDGLDIIRFFLARAKDFLAPGGKIYMEFDSPQKGEIEGLLKRYGYKKCEFSKDQRGKWRFVVISS